MSFTILVTDFVTRNCFAHQHSQSKIDFKDHAASAFEVLTGGYAQNYDFNTGWQQVTGSKASKAAAAKAPRGSGGSAAP